MFTQFCLSICLFSAVHLGIKAEQSFKIYTEHFPPYNYIEDSKITGINVEVVNQACSMANLDCQFSLYPWNRAMRLVKNNEFSGLISTAKTPERLNQFKWVGPLVSGVNCIYRLSSRTDIKVSKVEDAKAYKMGAARDAAYLKVLEKLGFTEGKNLHLYLGKYGQMKPLQYGRIDMIVGSANTIFDQTIAIGLKPSDLTPLVVIPSSLLLGNFLALNINVPNTIVENLQTHIDDMAQNGTMDKIRLDFVNPNVSPAPSDLDNQLWRDCMVKKS